MFGAKKLGDKIAARLEKTSEEWLAAASTATNPNQALHNRAVGHALKVFAVILREETAD